MTTFVYTNMTPDKKIIVLDPFRAIIDVEPTEKLEITFFSGGDISSNHVPFEMKEDETGIIFEADEEIATGFCYKFLK